MRLRFSSRRRTRLYRDMLCYDLGEYSDSGQIFDHLCRGDLGIDSPELTSSNLASIPPLEIIMLFNAPN